MDYAYFDASALIKRYVEELGRREVLALLRSNQCLVSAVLPVEVRSALRRRVTEKTLDGKRAPGMVKRLAADRALLDDHRGLARGSGDRGGADQRPSTARPRRHPRRVSEAVG